jgi:hypothetical protein
MPVEQPAREPGVPALFAWGDFDGDRRLDIAAVSGAGKLQILASAGDGRFEDVTERAGLAGIEEAALALWADYDGDGWLDLFVGARWGASRLYRNEGGAFTDMTAASGLACEGAVQSAQWFDHDGDGRLDLFVVGAEESALFRGLEGGFFEPAELPLAGLAIPGPGGIPLGSPEGGAGPDQPGSLDRDGSSARAGTRAGAPIGISVSSRELVPSGGSTTQLLPPPTMSCMDAIKDQANLPNCLQASTTPALGKLYPLSSKLFVAVSGNVGIGTTSPAAKLHVAGTARIADTLTLAPGGDQALNVSTGSIYKSGALFIHTRGVRNTAIGSTALASNAPGTDNTACGFGALFLNEGSYNTACGAGALLSNTTGYGNTATGSVALYKNTIGSYNTACGYRSLYSNTTGSNNTANGYRALFGNTTGDRNTASGVGALYSNTSGYRNTAAGHEALYSNQGGWGNAACGAYALRANTTGHSNVAVGDAAMYSNTSGFENTVVGFRALYSNDLGSNNAACGLSAMFSNTQGNQNVACGHLALSSNTTGDGNIALGFRAGQNLTTGDYNIVIGNDGVAGDANRIRIGTAGTHTRAFIAGIRGVTTGIANAVTVLIDSAGQLGTVSSSRRFKEEIRDMGDATERLLALRPVVFRYRPEVQEGERPLEYGLIAEEVAEVFPELVVYDEEGEPFTVKYHLLSSMLLNELKKQAHELETQRSELARLPELEARLAALEARGNPGTPAALPAGAR